MEELTEPMWVDCDDVDDHVDLWVSREKPLWVECRSSLVKVRVHIKDCESPAIACPPMGMYVCNEDIPRPGTNYFGYRYLSGNQFAGLGGSISDACGIWGVLYKDQVISTDPNCKTNRTIKRTFWAYDVNGNEKICMQDIIVADNQPPVFRQDPADLEIACDASEAAKIAAINAWLGINTNPGNYDPYGPGDPQDSWVEDRCSENMVMIAAVPGTYQVILSQMPDACDPKAREVIVVFTADDGCGNQATRSARVRLLDNVEPQVDPIPHSFYTCADDVPPVPNLGAVLAVSPRDNCTPSQKLKIELISDQFTYGNCPDQFTEVRTYRITDCDGNYKDRSHTIYVNDDVKPYWNPAPQPLFLMNVCGLADLTTQIQGWMNQNGYGSALDDCGAPTVSVDKAATDVAAYLRRFCDSPGNNQRTSIVTFTARDACGNTRSATATVRLMDNQPPTGQPPADAKYDCPDDVPQMLANQVIFLADNCSDGNTVQVAIEANPPAQPGCPGSPFFITRRWRLTDCAGNTAIVSQQIKIQDDTPPNWTNLPDDLVVQCNDGALNTKINDWLTNHGGSSAALDACDGSNVTYSYDPPSVNAILNALGTCAPKTGKTIVTFTAKDQCGNRKTATAEINVRDFDPPTATRVESNYSCPSQVPPADPAVITDETDACTPNLPSGVKVEYLPNATQNNLGKGCMNDPLIIIRWYKLTDCAGNTSSVSHRINVVDMTAPQALCKSLSRSLGPNGTVMVDATEFDNGSYDNCGIKKIEIRRGTTGPWSDKLTFDCSDIPNIPNCGANVENMFTLTIQMRVTDNCDQTDVCTTTIKLTDDISPKVECPADMTVKTSNNGGYDCEANATWNHPVPTDNCSVLCMTMEVLKEINGVFVTINPANGFPSPNYVVNVSPTNFGGVAGPYSFGKGPYCDDNEYKIVYRVRDEHGNEKPGVMCMFKITVKDDEKPKFNDCPDVPIVAQTVTGDCYQMKCWKRPTAFDNCESPTGPCPPPTVVVTVSNPTVMINQVGDDDCALFPVGRTVVTYTATDAEGNTATCTVEVLISDPEPPMAMCVAPFVINLEPDGDTQITFADIDAGSTDNCGICVKEIKRDGGAFGGTVDFTCADLGKSITITLRVKDCSRPTPNEHSCTTSVLVEDMQSPGIAFCPQDISVGTDNGVCKAVVTYPAPLFNDGCNSPKQGTLTQGLASGSMFPIGVTHVQYCYTSPSGYTVCCDFNVTVEDDENPNIVCPANVTNLTCQQPLPAPLTLGAFTGGTLTDNCGVTALDYSDYDDGFTACDNDPVHTVIRTYRAFDAAGNSKTCTHSFTYIEDSVAPIFSVNGTPISTTVTEITGATGSCASDVPASPAVTADDGTGCDGVVIDFEVVLLNLNNNGEPECTNKFRMIRSWVASDVCGNTRQITQVITINDTTKPVLNSKPGDMNLQCIDDVPAAPTIGATDNCGYVTVDFSESEDPGPISCVNSTIIRRTWTATDACGNTDQHTQVITVNDTTKPVLSGLPAETLSFKCASDVPAVANVTASDNCDVAFLDFSEAIDPNGCENNFVVIRTWRAIDACGNTAAFTQTITVKDDINPFFTNIPGPATVSCAANVPALVHPTPNDNCGQFNVDFAEYEVPGDCPNKYIVIRRWVVTDLCGLQATATQMITINDTTAPVFDQNPLPVDQTVNCAQDVPSAAVLTATDNCDGPVQVYYSEELKPGDCPNRFRIVRTWIAEDLCGNVRIHSHTITVNDTSAPVWNQPAPENPTVECSEQVPAVPVQTATDNCGVPVIIDFSEVQIYGTCPNQFSIVRTWRAQDDCGNSTTRVQVITVSDTKAPVWNQAPPVNLSFQCAENIPAPPVQTATDNCGAPVDLEYVEIMAPGTCPNSFVMTRVWTAEDDCGNITTRMQVLTVEDNTAPVLAGLPAASMTVECSEQVPAVAAVTVTDNCVKPIDLDFSEVEVPGTCPNQYVIRRTWRAQDDCGNATVFTQTITVSDTKAPVFAGLPAATVNVECSEQVPALAVVTATDNCNAPVDVEISEIEVPGTCPNQYVLKRTWTAEDDCGNITAFTQTITVSDTKAPVMAGLPAAVVNVVCASDVPAPAVVTATDNCGAPIDVELSEIEVPGSCVNKYTVKRTWTAEDDCGNITSFTQTINVNDNVAPELYAKPLRRHYDCIEDVEIAPYQFATDNCGVATVEFSETENPGNCPNWTVIERRWVAYDLCGNSSTWEQIIDVRDTIAPVMITTPVDRTYECVEDVEEAPVQVATDNCGPVFIDFGESENPGACQNQVVISRRWVAYDLCGNTSEVWQHITVYDDEAPVLLTTPTDRTYECIESVEDAPVGFATDNCDVWFVDFQETENPGTCMNQTVIIRRWFAYDLCGNTSDHWQTITVNDTKAPVLANLPPATVNVECSEQVPAVAAVTVSDNCAAPIDFDFGEVEIPGTCPNQYVIKRTWSAQDDCGNATVFTQTITINDTKAPVWTSPLPGNMTLQCGEQVPNPAVMTATDNCNQPVDIEAVDVYLPGNGPNDQAKIIRTWTAEDDCGNSTVHTQTIFIEDTQAPVLVGLPAATVNVECSEQVPALAVVTATDNCQGTVDVEVVEIEVPGTCPNQYVIKRTWTAVDFAGNSTIFTQTITINDTKAPVFAGLPAATVNVECSEQVPALAVVTATDNCAQPVDVEISEIEIPGTCPNQYQITRTWTAEDDCGNITTFVQTITVNDTKAPVFAGLPAATVNVECSEQVPALAVVTATDNCNAPVDVEISEIEVPGTCPNQYVVKRTWTAEDDCGNITSFIQTITVNDTKAPTWNEPAPATPVNVSCIDLIPAPPVQTASDNCAAPVDVEFSQVVTPGTCPNQLTVTRIWTAEDDCGNITTRIQVVVVNDTQAPVLVGLPAAVVNVECSEQVPALAVVTATDNCGAPIDIEISEIEIPGTCPNQYSITRTWTAEDDCGNITTFVQTINVSDTKAPVLANLPAATVAVSCSENVPAVPVVTATDNCAQPVDVEFSEVEVPGTCPNQYSITRTWTAEDDCGNATSFVQTITISDTQAPTFSGLPTATVNVSCAEQVPGVATVTASDNCNQPVDVEFSEVEVPGTCGNKYTVTRTWTAEDDCGNITSFVQTINVNDTEAPVWGDPNAPASVNVKCAADVPALVPQTATDNCGAPVIVDFSETVQPGSCLNKFTLIRTWSVQDDCGNATSRQQIVNVNDDVAPVMNCPAPLFAQCSPGEQPPYANLIEFTTAGGSASDNCGLNVNSFGLLSEVKNGNVYTRTYRVIDQCGNSTTCAQTLTVMDTQPPVFLNCPTGPLVFGNDPTMCWAKINWPNPVAVDNCSIPTVVQTAGPLSGSIVNVGTYTVSFKATDAAGNMSTCSFTVMVMDTEIPEFDADIVMPGDVTVECDKVPAPFVLTTNDVHDNCTPSNLLVITFTEVRTNGNCKFNYVLTRTWTVTDQAGKQLIHTQKVTVRDTTKPTALCKNATVTLDKFGNATVLGTAVNNGSFDNCSAQIDLTLTVTPSAFTCANLGNNVVTLTVTDECGNSATCTAIVTVLQGPGACTPQITAKTTCKNNATDAGDNGQFDEIITVKSLAMQTWTLTANTGFYATTSPAPPAAPILLPVGTTFTAGNANGIDDDGDGQVDEADEMVFYTLKGVHVEAIGYSIAIQNNLGQSGTVSNKAYYPSPYFKNLNGPFCLNTAPFTIEVGEYNNAQGTVINVMVNGVATTIFNAAQLGIGFHTVMATFDAGTATTNLIVNGQLVGGTDDQAQKDPGCQQKITKIVQVVNTPTTVVCNDLVHISLHNDGADCKFTILADDVLEGTYLCDDDYTVVLTYPFGTHTFNPANMVDYTHIGKTMKYTLVHAITGNTCWGNVKVEDKEPPILTCPANITIKCSDPTDVSFTGTLGVSDCGTTTVVDTDDFTDFGSCNNPRAQIIRTWLVTDNSGNQSSCSQKITILPFNLADVKFPADITLNCNNVNTDPSATGVPTINGYPIGTGGLCMASISKTDEIYDICTGSYELVRTWKVRNMCLPVSANNPIEHVQVIKIVDTQAPVFNITGDVTVSTDPFTCCATAALQDVIISENCSYVTSLEYRVVGVDFATGNLVVYEGTGSLADFQGNNWWNPDTLGVFGFTQCLPRGEYTVTYKATDACGNIGSIQFKMYVEDQVPPVAACDEFTQVALGGDGMAFVNASTFDDGSYDVCESVHFKARRMNDNDCQDHEFFLDQVKFCCEDINDTILVVFRVYDVPVPTGAIDQNDPEFEGHYNDCMVQVYVEDKIKPLCSPPANVTVTCENFDPSLWAYGAGLATDNCCVDTIITTANFSLFDTVCNRGTITRTFRAIDCAGNSGQCTQRVFVTYEQDYYVRFPNDVIVTTCNGTGNYGEPTFFGEDCELLGVSYEDELFTVVPDACVKIERTWTVINWCTYNPNAGCIFVPNPNPNATVNHPSNLPGPIVSAPNTPAPWTATVVKINPSDPTATNYATFWSANANCYQYKQIIKIIDTVDPEVENCPDSTVIACDYTPNDHQLWNESYWYDAKTGSHDLCEGPTDLTITATDLCSGSNVNIRYLLFLDLDGDGTMETVISSTNLPGFNNIQYGNGLNPNFSGGTPRQFDERSVPFNQKYGFALQTTTSGTKKTAAVRWNTQQQLTNYVIPELPYGKHKIKWIVEDGCGNEQVCEYGFEVKDCKAPTVVCLNGLSVNIMPTKMIQMWASDFLQYTEDNCTPSDKIIIGIRRSGTGTGFPFESDGVTPQTSVTFTCDDLGTQLVELWAMDLAGNVDYCETYIIVQDNAKWCDVNSGVVAGVLANETSTGLEDANVDLSGSHPALPPISFFNFTDDNGHYQFAAVPFLGDYTVTPTKDNDPLNGVSTYDLVLINKHVLGLEPLNSPYKMIAADANNSRSITTFDIVELRKLILGIYTELPNNTSWRFVDADYAFPDPTNPFQEIFPETKQIADMQVSKLAEDFVATKVGDVNGNATMNAKGSVEDRTEGTLLFDVQDRKVKAGETFTVNFLAAERTAGYQFTLSYPNLEVVDVKPGADMSIGNFGIFNSEHLLTTSFNNDKVAGEFTVTFRATASGLLSNMLAVSSRITKAEAYSLNKDRQAIGLRFNGQNGSTITGLGFELYQNQPNPWVTKTQIAFHLPEAAEATLTIFDETGRMLFTQKGNYGKGYNAVALDRSLLETTGVLYYKLETATDSAVKKMIQTK